MNKVTLIVDISAQNAKRKLKEIQKNIPSSDIESIFLNEYGFRLKDGSQYFTCLESDLFGRFSRAHYAYISRNISLGFFCENILPLLNLKDNKECFEYF